MKLVNKNPNNWVTPKKMKSGQIGIIRQWDTITDDAVGIH